MSTVPRVPPLVAGQPAEFATVTAHAGSTMQAFFELYATFWQSDLVSPDLKELTRLRNARITDCGY